MTDTASDLQREVDAFRSRLINMDRQASQVLSATYADTLKALQPRLDALEKMILNKSKGKGKGLIPPSWLFQQDRYRELIRQTNQLMAQYGDTTKTVVTAAQQAAVRASLIEAGSQLAAVSGGSPEIARLSAGWASIPDSAIQNMVGALQSSTPLGQLLEGFGKDAVQDVNRALLRGMALGLGGRESARGVQLALGITRARAESIVRTETLRAANTALLAAYGEFGVVEGWRWSAALSARTCSACLSRHGKVYPLKTPMDRHPQCRCSASPWLGNGDDAPWESGDAWLKRQPLPVQQGILGKEGANLFNANQLQLVDWQKVTQSKAWGASVSDGGVTWAKRQAAKAGRPVESPVESIQPLNVPQFKTLAEAEEWAREHIADVVHLQGTSIEHANQILRSVADNMRRVPIRSQGLEYLQGTGKMEYLVTNKGGSGGIPIHKLTKGAVAQATPRGIAYRPDKIAQDLRYVERFGNANPGKPKRWNVGNETDHIGATITHEYGHLISFNTEVGSSTKRAAKRLNQTEYRLSGADRFDFRERFSEYGLYNEEEFFAEAYVMYRYEPQNLPPTIRDAMTAILKEWTDE